VIVKCQTISEPSDHKLRKPPRSANKRNKKQETPLSGVPGSVLSPTRLFGQPTTRSHYPFCKAVTNRRFDIADPLTPPKHLNWQGASPTRPPGGLIHRPVPNCIAKSIDPAAIPHLRGPGQADGSNGGYFFFFILFHFLGGCSPPPQPRCCLKWGSSVAAFASCGSCLSLLHDTRRVPTWRR
jgi:hypothetical protein